MTYIISPKRYVEVPSIELDDTGDFENLASVFGSRVYKAGDVVNGIIRAVDKNYVTVDVGLKVDGVLPLKEFALLNKDGSITVKVGDVVKLFIESLEDDGGPVISLEKAILEERWPVLSEKFLNKEIVTGTIFSKVKCGFSVDLSGVACFLPSSQVDIRFRDIAQLMNTEQQFLIIKMDNKTRNIVVSRRAVLESRRDEFRKGILDKLNEGDIIEGAVKNLTNYGAFVDLGGIDGLLHVTDISWKRVCHPSEILSIGDKVRVKIIKFNREQSRVSLGMKQLEASPWKGIAEKYPIGSRHDAVITNITDYGAFASMGGEVEGLVYISEICWDKLESNPRNVLSLGQKIKVEVLGIDEEKNRISLSIKRCTDNPWVLFSEKYSCGDIIDVKIHHIVDFGIFASIEDSPVIGLIHVLDISWYGISNKDLAEYKRGEKIKAKILSINPNEEKLMLGIKQVSDDPMERAVKEFSVGHIADAIVSNIKDGIVEVNISRGVDAIIQGSELPKDEDGKIKYPNPGSTISIKISGIVPEARLITAVLNN